MKLKSINIITIYLRAHPLFVGRAEISPALKKGAFSFYLFIIAAPAAYSLSVVYSIFNIKIKDNIIAYL